MIHIHKDNDGSLDEIFERGCTVHLEKMDDDQWWLGIYGHDGDEVIVEFYECKIVEYSSQRNAEQAVGAVGANPTEDDGSKSAVSQKDADGVR